MPGSTFTAQASIPPVRFLARENPAAWSNWTACIERTPVWQ
jgi:hypothetical protein